VALTRARDTLALYGRRRSTKKGQEIPSGYLRELTEDPSLKAALRVCDPRLICAENVANAQQSVENTFADVEVEWISHTQPARGRVLELSASAIEAYATCPLKYALQKCWRIPEEPSAALQYGAAMHSALKDLYDAAGRGIERSPDDVVEIFLREFEQAKIDEELQRKLYERQGSEQLRQFLAVRAMEPRPHVLTTEKSFRFPIEDVMINGRIDRIDRLESGGVLVLDYKTGVPKEERDASTSIQLGIYGMAAQLEGHRVEKLAFYNLEDNTVAETKRINEERVYSKTIEVAAGIRAGDFSPTPGFHCKNCGYRDLCPATVEKVFAAADSRTAGAAV
jgi:RecB family exonuclease